MILNYDQAHTYVTDLQEHGTPIYWDGYTICFFTRNPRARYDPKGVLRDGKFGYESRSEVRGNGTWYVNPKWRKVVNA